MQNYLKYYSKEVQVMGIDFSPNMLKRAGEKANRLPVDI
ncbi:class I SAM-dependent methyltransferase [Virgibacillus proomii]|nr:class I SAM-dependent methyltransferase [Virgibacillus proomii]